MTTNVHTNQALTDFATGYRNGEYVADQVCLDIPCDKKKDDFYQFRRRDVNTRREDLIGPSSEPSELDFEKDLASFQCLDRGNIFYLNDEEMKFADEVLQLQQRKLGHLLNNILLGREIRVADFYDTNTNYASANRITATAAWSDLVAADPILDMHAAIASISPGTESDTELVCVFALEQWQKAQRHPKLTGLMSDSASGLVSPESFAAFFGLDRVIISRATKNTGTDASPVYARIWDTDKVRVVRNPKRIPDPTASMFAGRFVLQQGQSAQAAWSNNELRNVVVVDGEDAKRGAGEGSRWTKASLSESDPKVLQNDMAAIITSA